MNAPYEPTFGPMADDDRYTKHLAAVKKEAFHSLEGDKFLEKVRLLSVKFDGTYHLPAGDRVAGYKSPDPPNSVSGGVP